jgi:hypothetical protein
MRTAYCCGFSLIINNYNSVDLQHIALYTGKRHYAERVTILMLPQMAYFCIPFVGILFSSGHNMPLKIIFKNSG